MGAQPISDYLDPGKAPYSTRAMVVSFMNTVNHAVEVGKTTLGTVS